MQLVVYAATGHKNDTKCGFPLSYQGFPFTPQLNETIKRNVTHYFMLLSARENCFLTPDPAKWNCTLERDFVKQTKQSNKRQYAISFCRFQTVVDQICSAFTHKTLAFEILNPDPCV